MKMKPRGYFRICKDCESMFKGGRSAARCLTCAEIRRDKMAKTRREQKAKAKNDPPKFGKIVGVFDVRRCRVCGCTDDDCRQCIEKTGRPCHWVKDDLCSACEEASA